MFAYIVAYIALVCLTDRLPSFVTPSRSSTGTFSTKRQCEPVYQRPDHTVPVLMKSSWKLAGSSLEAHWKLTGSSLEAHWKLTGPLGTLRGSVADQAEHAAVHQNSSEFISDQGFSQFKTKYCTAANVFIKSMSSRLHTRDYLEIYTACNWRKFII